MSKPEYTIKTKKIARHTLPTATLGVEVTARSNWAHCGCLDGVYELNLADGASNKLYSHDSYVSGIVGFAEPQQIISAGYDGTLRWYDLAERKEIRSVEAHRFWSWDIARAKNAPVIASVTGQYLAGGYRYEPRASEEPCVRVYDALSGEQTAQFGHLPPVQAVALSDDGAHVGAGNLMGDAAVWNIADGSRRHWNTPDFTAFGIIKSHCQIGGIYAATFAPDNDFIVGGMGPMRDPMAGNGKQRWQRFAWQDAEPSKTHQSRDDQCGEGLMETMCFHPGGRFFAMAGRLRGGNWNVGLFDDATGELVHSIKIGGRITQVVFNEAGDRMFLSGALSQNNDRKRHFGFVETQSIEIA